MHSRKIYIFGGVGWFLRRLMLLSLLLCGSPQITAATPTPSVAAGERHIAAAKCEACHQSKISGKAGHIYRRADRRVTTKAKLAAQVERCDAELNLGLFPDDLAEITAYLNATYYQFKD